MFSEIDEVKPDIQANILKGHGRNYANFIFLKFKRNKAGQLRAWIRNLAGQAITSAQVQERQSKSFKDRAAVNATGSEFVTCFFLTAKGYDLLKLAENMPRDEAFQEGMKNRKGILGDQHRYWEGYPLAKRYHGDFSALILLANNFEKLLELRTHELIFQLADFVEEPPLVESGECKKKIFPGSEKPVSIDIFGYADGLSQPDVSTLEKALEVVLHQEEQVGRYGSFMVFRKFQQFKDPFDKLVEYLVKKTNPEVSNPRQFIEAQIMGRFKNGTPLALEDKPVPHPDNWQDVDFDYAHDALGARCPFHAHARKMNPRTGAFPAGKGKIIRRGITYFHGIFDRLQRIGGNGLLFVSYQQNIVDQFEFLQTLGRQDRIQLPSGQKVSSGRDLIVKYQETPGQGPEAPPKWNRVWGNPGIESIKYLPSAKKTIKLRGGEYFYAPSIPFLKEI